jgi:FtsH-binding integral membrane protein
VSAPSLVIPAPDAAAVRRPSSERRVLLLAGLYCVLGAIAVTMWLWRDPASRIVAANPADTDQFTWFFRYDATAIAHFRLPALTTEAMNAPQGVSVMWNTFMLLPGALLTPVTLLAGPQVSLTVLLTAGFAGSAFTMFTVLRRWDVSVPAAGLGVAVVGLYMSPPEHALVLAVDQKSPIRALEWTAPCLLMLPTTPERRRHDCVRHGTTRRTWT